jgi:hypothetical protein
MRTSALWALLPLFLGTAACSDPVVGSWKSDKKLGNGKYNTLEVVDDGTGDATLYATPDSNLQAWVRFKFTLDWEEDAGEFDLTMKCKDRSDVPCNGDGFVMKCEAVDTDEGEKLDCKGTKHWTKYPFDWASDEG